MATIKAPIWQDIYYTSTTYTMLEYVINKTDQTVIYAGRAYQRPGGNGISINITKICQDYIKDSFSNVDFRTLVGSTYTHPEAYVEFELRERSTGNLLNTYGFVYDWSYEGWNGGTRTVSNPINNHKAAGMYDFTTECRMNTEDFKMELVTSVFRVAGGNACGEIALYYKNRKGGWDEFLIEGTVTKKDEYTKYTYNRSFNNNTLEFENGTYHSQIVTSYVLNTGWLNDQQSDNLAFNLLSSNEVYLHNLCTDKVYPVVIKDNTATYKTYKNNSRKLVNYQINVEESQRKEVL
jgi:hypothetical protein